MILTIPAKLKDLGLDEELETARPMTSEQSAQLISEATSKFGILLAYISIYFLSVIIDQNSFDALEYEARESIPSSEELAAIDWEREFSINIEANSEILESPRGEERTKTLLNTLSVRRFDSTYMRSGEWCSLPTDPRESECMEAS